MCAHPGMCVVYVCASRHVYGVCARIPSIVGGLVGRSANPETTLFPQRAEDLHRTRQSGHSRSLTAAFGATRE